VKKELQANSVLRVTSVVLQKWWIMPGIIAAFRTPFEFYLTKK